MKTKKIVNLVSLLSTGLMFLSINSVNIGICRQSDYGCRTMLDKIEHFLYFFPIILFFSLITYKMKDVVFETWWKFAKFVTPLVLVTSFVISLELHHSPGGIFNMDNEVDLIMYFSMYSVFTIGSIIAIVRGYRNQSKLTGI